MDLIEEERQKFEDKSSRRIFLGGNSQGNMLGLATFLRYSGPTPLGGYAGIIGMNALPKSQASTTSEDIAMQSETPMLLYNAGSDPIFNIRYVRNNLRYFRNVVYGSDPKNFTWIVEENMGHVWSQNFQKLFSEFNFKY